MKKILFVFLIMGILFISGCNKEADKVFSSHNFSITVTKQFTEKNMAGYDFYITSVDNTIMVNICSKESLVAEYGELNSYEYTKLVLESNGIDSYIYTHLSTTQPFYYLYYTTYHNYIDDYGFMMVVIENNDYFYIFNLAADYDVFEESKPLLMKWAMTITFDDWEM